jgi:hypothetical protein
MIGDTGEVTISGCSQDLIRGCGKWINPADLVNQLRARLGNVRVEVE